jgi:hypothetical protein
VDGDAPGVDEGDIVFVEGFFVGGVDDVAELSFVTGLRVSDFRLEVDVEGDLGEEVVGVGEVGHVGGEIGGFLPFMHDLLIGVDELDLGGSDADDIAVVEHLGGDFDLVEACAVGGVEVADAVSVGGGLDDAVFPAGAVVDDDELIAGVSADGEGFAGEGDALFALL